MSENELMPTAVVTAFLRHGDKVLLVQRSQRVGSYQGCWSAISGYLEGTTPLMQARREIREETGLKDEEVHLVASGHPVVIEAPELGKLWVVHPFLFDIDDPQHIRLDWENVSAEWVAPAHIGDYPTVPKLVDTLNACLALEL